MKASYRGHTISVSREECLGGWPLLYLSVFRDADGYECLMSVEDGDETVASMVAILKERIDAELASDDPWLEHEDDCWQEVG